MKVEVHLNFHIEPVLPMIKLIIYGDTPTAYALANMGSHLNYNCIICSTDPIKAKDYQKK